DAAANNASNLAGKVNAVTADAQRVQNDLAAKLEQINKTHDTFMAGVETVRAVSDGDANKALRQGGKFMAGAGYADLGNAMTNAANKADALGATIKAVKTGDVATGLEAAGTFAGLSDLAATGRKINEAKRVKEAADQGDIANVVYGAGSILESNQLMEAGWDVYNAQEAKRAVESGDAAAAAGALGNLTKSKALGNTAGTIRDVQNAKAYADAGQYGNAISSLGSAAGNNKVKKLGDQVDATEEAALAAQGKDRYGNTISDAERIAGVMGGMGRATDSADLTKGARMTRQADSLAQAIDKRQQAAAMNAASSLASEAGRKQASQNMREKVVEDERRERLAAEIGDEIDNERNDLLVDRVAQASGVEIQKMEGDKEAKEFEKKAQKGSHIANRFGQIGDVLTGGGGIKERFEKGKQVAESLAKDETLKG
ncbi:MAG: hypothetical protein FJZ01_20125, partial [Candidatus Sericytochromatia bacterium]|nr:hypothetical protein [Candidatus Tanganyikabacteria bacterium]